MLREDAELAVNCKIQRYTQSDVIKSKYSILELTLNGSLRCKPNLEIPRELYNENDE